MSASKPPASRWGDLPTDLLGDISTRLDNVADFVRFHAVCRPWRDLQLHSPAVRLLRSRKGRLTLHSVVNLGGGETASNGCSCDDITLVKPPGAPSAYNMNWVAREDGTAAWLFTWSPEPGLIDLLTGAITLLPLFPCDDETRRFMANPHGVVYNDGTIFLYSFTPETVAGCIFIKPIFMVAVLRRGDVAWRSGTSRIDMPISSSMSVAYHNGKVLLCMAGNLWCVLTVDNLGGEMLKPRWNLVGNPRENIRGGSYVFESCGKLMWVSILIQNGWSGRRHSVGDELPRGAVSVTVQVLEETSDGGHMCWVARDVGILADRVLFLGSPTSFTVDAASLGMADGFAYFVYWLDVYTYNLVSGEAKLVDRLGPSWPTTEPFMWLRPHPTIAPIRKSKERLQTKYKNVTVQ